MNTNEIQCNEPATCEIVEEFLEKSKIYDYKVGEVYARIPYIPSYEPNQPPSTSIHFSLHKIEIKIVDDYGTLSLPLPESTIKYIEDAIIIFRDHINKYYDNKQRDVKELEKTLYNIK